MEATPLIAAHALTAALALSLGPVNLFRRPFGDKAHRLIGRVWLVAMAATCLTSFGIRSAGFSWLHALSAFTLFTITSGLIAAIRGNIRSHRANMIGSYLGSAIAFIFAAVLPNRLIAKLALGDPVTLVGLALLVLAAAALVSTLAIRSTGRRPRPITP